MINRIKYMLKVKKTKIHLSIKKSFEDENIKKLRGKNKIKAYLKKCFFHPICTLNSIFKNDFNIKYIEIVLTTKCTLNCKGCSALMDYYDKRNDMSLDKNIKSLKRILDSCDSIDHLRLLGGEPLLYPNLYEMLYFIKNQEKINRVSIVTNGTLLIKDNKILDILKDSKFDVFISDYGKISRKKDELIKLLKTNNIRYILGNKDFMWRDYGDLECRNRKKSQLKKQFLNCEIMCTSILNGNIFHCPRNSHGTNLKKIPLKEQDYVNLLDDNIDIEQLRKKLYKFFYKYTPYVEACNHCDYATKELKSIPAGQQINRRNVS